MPALFTGPQFVALSALHTPLPGAKLTFTQTGTSTPQNVYQDLALTVPHANPVVANGAGVFAPIYLDPSLPSYRVLLTDSSDVTQPGYPIDNYPSNQNTGQTFRLKSAAPELIFEETDATAGNQKWRIRVNAKQMRISLLNDAESIATDLAIIDRSGSTVDLINLFATNVQANSLELPGAVTAKKTADTDRSNTTTLADDPHLTVSVPVAGIYRVDVFLSIIGVSGGDGGFKYQLVPTNGLSSSIEGYGLQSINTVTAIAFGSSLDVTTCGTLGSESLIQNTSYLRLLPSGSMTLALQWAQNSSNADITRLSSNSILSITRIINDIS
jgi:hypothetical protein